MRWDFDLASDIGARSEQQDRAAVFALPQASDATLVVLADGMGGQRDGGLAAQVVLDTAERALVGPGIGHPQHFLHELCRRAHAAIRKLGRQRRSTPGSTCVMLYLSGDEAYWAHVGDSRLYHFDADGLLAQTRDHTVAELLDHAENDQRLYTCLGGQNTLQPQFGASATGSGDWFMLCSDGFWNQVGADEVAAYLTSAPPGEPMANGLVALASERGGAHSDNVSLVLVRRKASRLARTWHRVFG